MRAYELFETLAEQDVDIFLKRRISELSKVMSNFSTVVAVSGYQSAYNQALEIINESTNVDWFIVPFLTNNPKLALSYKKLVNLRNTLQTKIDSGV